MWKQNERREKKKWSIDSIRFELCVESIGGRCVCLCMSVVFFVGMSTDSSWHGQHTKCTQIQYISLAFVLSTKIDIIKFFGFGFRLNRTLCSFFSIFKFYPRNSCVSIGKLLHWLFQLKRKLLAVINVRMRRHNISTLKWRNYSEIRVRIRLHGFKKLATKKRRFGAYQLIESKRNRWDENESSVWRKRRRKPEFWMSIRRSNEDSTGRTSTNTA